MASGHACLSTQSGGGLDLDLATIRIAPAPGCWLAAAAHASAPAPTAAEEVIAQPQSVGGPPAPASSYYVYAADVAACNATATTGCRLYVDGADETAPAGGALIILDFGAPCFDPVTNIYGSQLFNSTSCTTDDQLLILAQEFMRGYESTHGAGTASAILGLGTSNSKNGVNASDLTAQQMTDSGTAWYQKLVAPFVAATAGAAAPLVGWAANDIEDSNDAVNWQGPATTIPWVDGYGTAASTSLGSVRHCSGNDPYRMADYGDDVLNAGGWTDADIYHVAWGEQAACAVPEIYVSGNGAEWQRTSQWGATNAGSGITFTGPMSLGGEGTSLSTQASWNNLASATGQAAPYITDIGSLNSSTPSAPTGVIALASDQAATVWWSPPPTDGGSPVQDYTVTAFQGATPGSSVTVRGLPPPTSATVPGLTNGSSYTFVVSATNAAGSGTGSFASGAVVPGPGRYHPLTPTRILDTRNNIGGFNGALGPGGTITEHMKGAGPIPVSGVAAVVLNVTVTGTTAASYLTVWPDQVPRPTASNLNWTAGMTVPNLVEVPLGPDGGVSFFNAGGLAHVIADVEGYVGLASETAAPDGLYAAISPNRVLDTRSGIAHSGALAPGQSISLKVGQTGQEAVVLNVTVAGPTASSYLTVWPHGGSPPVVSNLNFSPGQTVANRVMVKTDSNGLVDIFNASGFVQVIADLNGAFTDATPAGSGTKFQGVQPVRILDTRDGTGGFSTPLAQGASRAVNVAGTNGIPAGATAVVGNLTATDTTAPSYLTAWPDGQIKPNASDLNWVAHQTMPNLVVVMLGSNGKLDLYNAGGSTDVVLDVVGYYR